jgi:pimeloyl-ACP methyl ester carboxylesterase
VPGSTLLECEGAGHMVILERHEQVNAALDQLIAAAQAHEPVEPQ